MKIDPSDQVINIDFARAGLEDFFGANTSRLIRFFSAGEPTQAFNEMVKIREIAHQMVGSSLQVELETNGFFNNEIANWIEENVDILWISCDGPPSIQDSQRPTSDNRPSSDVVLENVRRFAKCHNIQFGVRPTISRENLDRQVELIEFFDSMRVKYVSASPTYRSMVNPRVTTPSLVEFAEHFVPAFHRAKELGMFYQTLLIVNFDEEVDIYCQACVPCPRLTTDGFVSCCDWVAFGPKYLPGPLQECIYGCYDKGNKAIVYDQVRIDHIRKRNAEHLGNHACKNCRALHHCAGGCLGKMMSETGNLYQATDDWCAAVRYLFDRLHIDGLFPYLHP